MTLALRGHGSHYGFLQDGVTLSKLQPGVATIYRTLDGGTHLETWRSEDDMLLPILVDARQNGVPLIDYESASERYPAHWSISGEQVTGRAPPMSSCALFAPACVYSRPRLASF